MSRVVVVVPTYNEAENLPLLLPKILARDARLEVLVVDDDSPDGTGRIADEFAARNPRIHVLHRSAKSGLGRGLVGLSRLHLDAELLGSGEQRLLVGPGGSGDLLAQALLLGTQVVEARDCGTAALVRGEHNVDEARVLTAGGLRRPDGVRVFPKGAYVQHPRSLPRQGQPFPAPTEALSSAGRRKDSASSTVGSSADGTGRDQRNP